MRIDRDHRGWFLFSSALLAASAAGYALYAKATPGGPKGDTWIGLLFGVVGTAMIVFAAVLGGRKKMLLARVGPIRVWLKGHLWLGALSLPMILFHGAFRFGGLVTTALMWLLITVVVSGIVGAVLQHIIPGLMLAQLDQEATWDEHKRRRRNLEWKAAQIVETACGEIEEAAPLRESLAAYLATTPVWGPQHRGKEEREDPPIEDTGWFDHAFFQTPKPKAKGGLTAGEKRELTTFYVTRVMPYLRRPRRPKKEARPLGNESSSALLFDAMRAKLPKVHEVLDELETLCTVTRHRAEQARYQRLMAGWLVLHIPLSMALLVLTVAHIIMALRY